MLKASLFKRIAVATLFLLVATILYKYPDNIKTIEYIEKDGKDIFLIDNNGYVSLTKSVCVLDNNDIDNIIKIYMDNKCIPDGFYSYLDKDIKVLDYKIEDGLLKINFNDKFFYMPKGYEERIIEMLVYSFTSLNDVKKVMFFVDGEILDRIPNTGKRINVVLDRNFGVNKVVEINTISAVNQFNVYYLGYNDEEYYYIPVTYIVNEENVARLIISKLKSNNINSSLLTHLNNNVELVDFSIDEGKIDIMFNSYLNELLMDGVLKEEVKYSLEASFMDSFNVKNVEISIYE